MLFKNTKTRFGLITISFHWVMALLIIALLCVGLYMTNPPVGEDKLSLFPIHKEFGILVLGLACLRFSWRLMNVLPQLSIPLWELLAARLVHWALYLFLFAMPLSGWALSSAGGYPISFFGLFTVPPLINPNKGLEQLFGSIHYWLAYSLMATLVLHSAAALKHHFYDKDDVLRRMLYK